MRMMFFELFTFTLSFIFTTQLNFTMKIEYGNTELRDEQDVYIYEYNCLSKLNNVYLQK